MDRADVKDRGKKHIRSKNRYKGKRFTKEDTQLPARQEALPSNHDRYELSDSDEHTAAGADFALLASAPTSIGGHFQFKGDALQTTHESIDSSSKYLQSLDADLLSYSIRTVPFHLRCGIDSKYITAERKAKLCQNAGRNEVLYQEYLKHLHQKSGQEKVVSEEAIEDICEGSGKISVEDRREGDIVLNTERAELEDWLDDVLNS